MLTANVLSDLLESQDNVPPLPPDVRLLEDGGKRLLEDGSFRLLE